MARQLLKVFSFFFLIFIIFSSCLGKANVNEKKTENITYTWIDRNLDDNPLKLIKKVEYNMTGYRYKEPENYKIQSIKIYLQNF